MLGVYPSFPPPPDGDPDSLVLLFPKGAPPEPDGCCPPIGLFRPMRRCPAAAAIPGSLDATFMPPLPSALAPLAPYSMPAPPIAPATFPAVLPAAIAPRPAAPIIAPAPSPTLAANSFASGDVILSLAVSAASPIFLPAVPTILPAALAIPGILDATFIAPRFMASLA